MNILGNVGATLGPSLDDFGVSLVYIRQLLAMLGPSWGYLWGSWGLLWSTLGVSWVMLGLCWGYLGAIFGPLGASSATFSSNIENRTSLKCLNRSRTTSVEQTCNVQKQRCHRTLHSHTSLESLNRSRSTPVQRKHTNPKL